MIYPQIKSFYTDTNRLFYGLAPPLGLLYLARILEDDGEKVTILDFSAEPFDKSKLINTAKSVDFIGMTILSVSYQNQAKIIQILKTANPDTPTVNGGPHCTLFPRKALNDLKADISISGDGESDILEIKNALQGKKNISKVPNIYYRSKD